MYRLQVALLLAIALAWVEPIQAQHFFARKPRPNASQRVPELILILKTDSDERKRQHAAEELRDYDAVTYTEIVPVLVDVLQNDKKLNVRLEALNSLTRIRPAHPLAGPAIEKAASDDESWRVRWQARTTLTKMQITNLTAKKGDAAQVKKKPGDESPLEDEASVPLNTFTVEVVPSSAPSATPTPRSPSNNAVPRPLPSSVNPSVRTPVTNPAPATPAPAPAAPVPATPSPRENAPVQGPSLFP